MSEDHFHVHGPHDHAVEHAAEHGSADSFSGRIAVMSAVLATLGALMSFAGGDTQANATLFKNNAAIKKTEANDQWAYYQAKGNKQNLSELGTTLATQPEKIAFYKTEVERYKKEKGDIKDVADKLEAESKAWDERSEVEMHHHHRWALGATSMQISIALSAVALLARRDWLVYAVYVVSAIGLIFGALGLAGI
jgi:ABC-type antimicrobial peptide transport system permease subunit